jgi:hypothetical protein
MRQVGQHPPEVLDERGVDGVGNDDEIRSVLGDQVTQGAQPFRSDRATVWVSRVDEEEHLDLGIEELVEYVVGEP